MAVTSDSGSEREAKSPIRVQEEDRHLQFRLFDVVSSVGNGMRGPQGLRHHSSSTHDPTVEYPGRLVGRLTSDILRNGSDNEGIAFSSRIMRGGDVVAFQEANEVPLSSWGTETLGYISIHENLWVSRVKTGERVQRHPAHRKIGLLLTHCFAVECFSSRLLLMRRDPEDATGRWGLYTIASNI
jgi:hypothetical protein